MVQCEHHPAPTHHLPKDIVEGYLNHNWDISDSTIPFYPVIFLLYLPQLFFYNWIKLLSKYTFKKFIQAGFSHVSHNTLQAGFF